MNLLQSHKQIDKNKQKEFESKIKEITKDFIRFQIERNCRAVIHNRYQGTQEYPPNALIDLVCSFNFLGWRIMEESEKKNLQEQLLKDAGIELPNK